MNGANPSSFFTEDYFAFGECFEAVKNPSIARLLPYLPKGTPLSPFGGRGFIMGSVRFYQNLFANFGRAFAIANAKERSDCSPSSSAKPISFVVGIFYLFLFFINFQKFFLRKTLLFAKSVLHSNCA